MELAVGNILNFVRNEWEDKQQTNSEKRKSKIKLQTINKMTHREALPFSGMGRPKREQITSAQV